MKLKKNSLTVKVWIYLSIFSIIILAFLWFFQIISLDTFYRYIKIKELDKITAKIQKNIDSNYEEYLDNISIANGVCIELYQNGSRYYQTNNKRDCITDSINPNIQDYKTKFYYSNLNTSTYETINPRFNNKTLISGTKLNNNMIVFVTTSLVPLDSSVSILKQQLIYITIIIVLLAFLISYFISKKLSNPIIRISNSAKEMANGDYNVVFDSNTNIAEIDDLINNLNYARDELGKTEELRRELLANVGHDLKTPLTMIKAYAEMAKDLNSNNKKKRNENLDVIVEETDRLNNLVNDILELSKLQANINDLKVDTFDLKELINNILKRYEALKINEGYNIEFSYNKEALVCADKQRIEQVIYNLINNAINYTGNDKKVMIDITEKDKFYQISISDTGSGIDSKDLKLIWDKYYKIDKNHKRKTVGTGLGLSIVKNILVKHNSNYGVITSKKTGTTFYFELEKKEI